MVHGRAPRRLACPDSAHHGLRRHAVCPPAARSVGRLKARAAATHLLHSLIRRDVPGAVATGALLSIGPAALPGIRSLLSHAHPRTRADAVELLGLLGNPADSPLLRERLADEAAAV